VQCSCKPNAIKLACFAEVQPSIANGINLWQEICILNLLLDAYDIYYRFRLQRYCFFIPPTIGFEEYFCGLKCVNKFKRCWRRTMRAIAFLQLAIFFSTKFLYYTPFLSYYSNTIWRAWCAWCASVITQFVEDYYLCFVTSCHRVKCIFIFYVVGV